MDNVKTLPKRAATSKETTGTALNPLKVPEILSRYSTRLPAPSLSPETSPIVPVYSPAPKPSQLLLDYLNSPSSKSTARRSDSPKLNKLLSLAGPGCAKLSQLSTSKSLKTSKSKKFPASPASPAHLKLPESFHNN